MGRFLKNRELESAAYVVRMPVGKNINGPQGPVNGLIRYNSTVDRPEAYYNNRWRSMQGNELNVPVKDIFLGDGSKTVFGNMSYSYPAGNEIFLFVFVHNVFQNPGVAFTVNNYEINFTSPPPRNHPIVVLHGVVNGSPFESIVAQPLPPPPIIPIIPTSTSTTTTTTTAGPGTTTTTAPAIVGVSAFTNGNFNNTTSSYSNQVTSLIGWKVYHQSIRLNGYSTFLDCATPSVRDFTMPGYEQLDGGTASAFHSVDFVDDTIGGVNSKALRMVIVGTTYTQNYVVRGPILVSNDYVNIQAGDRIQFNWKAVNKPLAFYVDENYDICAYLLSSTGCKSIVLLKATGSTTEWTTAAKTFTAADAGLYRFVFVSGSVDSSGQKVVGSQVYIDNIELIKA